MRSGDWPDCSAVVAREVITLMVDAEIQVENRAGIASEVFHALALELAVQRSVRHVLEWLLHHDPPLRMDDMVTQDEFSHDILVPYRGQLYLAYDST
jgi:hypothetical protein